MKQRDIVRILAACLVVVSFSGFVLPKGASAGSKIRTTPTTRSRRKEPATATGCTAYEHLDNVDLKHFEEKMEVELDEQIEQSSAKFTDFKQGRVGWKLPKIHPQQHQTDAKCDPKSSDFSLKHDTACLRYLSDHRNWESITPMASILSQARTIKFKVKMYHQNVTAILKVSQYKFLYEPYAELLAYNLDRLLEVNRIPPVAWVSVPVDWLRAVASTQDAMYTQWVEKFVFSNKVVSKTLKPRCPFKNDATIRASLQLWVDNVVRYRKSEMAVKQGLSKLTGKIDFKETDTFGLSELSSSLVFDYLIANNDRTEKNTFATVDKMIYLDQGSSFYGRDPPRGTPLRITAKHNTSVCVFSKRLKEVLEGYMIDTKLKKELNMKLTDDYPGIWEFVKKWQTGAVQSRLEDFKKIWEYCEKAGLLRLI
eukprot:TRINITY_DN34710_c0_g1_i1.p1 TRINITY_DN34710_c0_g1~~TRINITY_DN34710_c0_g1_i1.p1  ORF type:complete len:435 (+),score=84.73 TRINITY_DN34710_c0_g1_i1:34-1305(+)